MITLAALGIFSVDPAQLVRTVVVAILAYLALVVVLRLSGKRTLAKWNAFDLIVTIALGSTLATVAVSPDVSLFEGVSTLVIFVVLQYVLTFVAVRLHLFERAIKSRPALLVHGGVMQKDAMKRERVSEAEILGAARSGGFGDLRDVGAVVLETDGSFSVIGSLPEDPAYSTLRDVKISGESRVRG
jgi:uncharacterized membrane protein YcaP (DUF421 family)